jgi:predicted RNA-binding protein with PUA-like domain
MAFFLVKSEPDVYSIEDLERDGRTSWEGVRNFQARNLLREMKAGDGVLFHHSSADPPGVAGVATVARAAQPDPTARDRKSEYFDPRASDEDPRWYTVELAFEERFPRLVPLEELKGEKALAGMELLRRGSRLSVQPVTKGQFEHVRKLGRKKR